MRIANIENKRKTQFFKFPTVTFTPNETRLIFERKNTVGIIRQLTFEVISNNNTNWRNSLIKIYIDDNAEQIPDLVLSPDDIINGLGHINTDRRMLDCTVYYFSNNRRSKVSIKLNIDFFKSVKIEATAGNGNTSIGVWMLYDVYYYSVSNQ